MDWSLLGCGAGGHVTFAPDERALRERFSITAREGAGWRCLRCGTFVIGPPTATGPAATAPRVRRGKELRSALILRIFAVERFLRAILFAALAIGVWRFSVSRLTVEQAYERELPAVRTLLRQLGFNVQHSHLFGLISRAFTLNSNTLVMLAILAAGYAVLEVVEGTGLWLLKRWGEYFAMVATSVFIPYEIYDLTAKVTVLRVLAFLINVALVVYLVLAKRLFGVRGGKKAYEAALRSESILDAEIAALAAEHPGEPGAATQPEAADKPGPASQATAPSEIENVDQPGMPSDARPATGDAEAASHPGPAGDAETASHPGPADDAETASHSGHAGDAMGTGAAPNGAPADTPAPPTRH
jgi:uncharacterized membrane protein (DUF2068 family)